MKDLIGQEVNESDAVVFSHDVGYGSQLFLGTLCPNDTIVLLKQQKDPLAIDKRQNIPDKHQNIPFVKMAQLDNDVEVSDIVIYPSKNNRLVIGMVTWVDRDTPAYEVLIKVRISDSQEVFVIADVAKLNLADVDPFTLLKLPIFK